MSHCNHVHNPIRVCAVVTNSKMLFKLCCGTLKCFQMLWKSVTDPGQAEKGVQLSSINVFEVAKLPACCCNSSGSRYVYVLNLCPWKQCLHICATRTCAGFFQALTGECCCSAVAIAAKVAGAADALLLGGKSSIALRLQTTCSLCDQCMHLHLLHAAGPALLTAPSAFLMHQIMQSVRQTLSLQLLAQNGSVWAAKSSTCVEHWLSFLAVNFTVTKVCG
jgi:hypothetical protein